MDSVVLKTSCGSKNLGCWRPTLVWRGLVPSAFYWRVPIQYAGWHPTCSVMEGKKAQNNSTLVQERSQITRRGLMIWGRISIGKLTDCVPDAYYPEWHFDGRKMCILKSHVETYAIGDSFLLIHNNSRTRSARPVENMLETEGIQHMECSVYSPDLNPTANV